MSPSSRLAQPLGAAAGTVGVPAAAMAPVSGAMWVQEAPLTARLAAGGALPASEVARAESCLAVLGVATLGAGGAGHAPRGARAGANGDITGAATLTVVGSWSLAEAQALVASGDCGAVRGVGLLEYCTEHAERRDLLTGTETPPRSPPPGRICGGPPVRRVCSGTHSATAISQPRGICDSMTCPVLCKQAASKPASPAE